MRIVSWNVAGGARHERIVERLLRQRLDVIALAHCTSYSEHKISAALAKATFQSPIFTSLDQYRVVCYTREDVEVLEPPAGLPLPERWIEVYFPRKKLRVLAVYVPQWSKPADRERKEPFWSEILKYAEKWKNEKALIIGDLNSGLRGIDARQTPDPKFTCGANFRRVSELYSDVWRRQHVTPEFTWYSKSRDVPDASNAAYGFRLDHAFASPPLEKFVQSCEYDHTVRRAEADCKSICDHSLIEVTLSEELG